MDSNVKLDDGVVSQADNSGFMREFRLALGNTRGDPDQVACISY